MKKNILILILSILAVSGTQSQTIFEENFENTGLPTGWSIETNSTDGGWIVGTTGALSSQYWPIPSNGSVRVIATNDDQCNCNKNKDVLITPPIDLSSVSAAVISVDVFFGKRDYQGSVEDGLISISIDNGVTWEVLKDLSGNANWNTQKIDLTEFAGEASVLISFTYNDDGEWLYGFAIDNVIIEVPNVLDASLASLKSIPFALENVPVNIGGNVYNNGVTPITSINIDYIINGEDTTKGLLEGLNIPAFEGYDFIHPLTWTEELEGVFDIVVEITAVNGSEDEISDNNSLSMEVEVFKDIVRENKIDEFLLSNPVTEVVATEGDQLDKPNDLDFFPVLAKNELWIVNERVENSGGSTVTIFDAGTPDQTFWQREDGNAWHFMSMPTGIAFSNNLNFGTSPGVQDANHGGGTFTGPSLWSSDPAIYAQPSGGNGSHLDMLHGSPYSMGIASEKDNVFWTFDSWNKEIVRYDFVEDHGPGNDDHADGEVRRYSEIEIERDGNVPSHMVIDDAGVWLYAVDNGNDRVIRLDINSGQVNTSLPLINEQLAEHSQMGNVVWEEIINTGLDRPCGIDVIDNRLIVGDYATGDIIIYDIDNNFSELGRLSTGASGLTGLKIGPDGAIWYTNKLNNTVSKMVPGELTSIEETEFLAQINISPNPTSGILQVNLPTLTETNSVNLELHDLTGKVVLNKKNVHGNQSLNISHLPAGVYVMFISSESFMTTRSIILTK